MKPIKTLLAAIAIILIIVFAAALSYTGVFLQEPKGEPAYIEWEKYGGY